MNLTEIGRADMHEIRGGGWQETTWGVMLGSAFVAGFIGSGGLLIVAGAAGAALVMDGYVF